MLYDFDYLYDLVVEFDELGFVPSTLVPDINECVEKYKSRLIALIDDYVKLKKEVIKNEL